MCHVLTSTLPAFQVKINETASRTNMLRFIKLFHKVFSGKIFAAQSFLKKKHLYAFIYDFRYASSQKLNQSESCNIVEPLSLHNLRLFIAV